MRATLACHSEVERGLQGGLAEAFSEESKKGVSDFTPSCLASSSKVGLAPADMSMAESTEVPESSTALPDHERWSSRSTGGSAVDRNNRLVSSETLSMQRQAKPQA